MLYWIISLLFIRLIVADFSSQSPRLVHFTIDCGIGKLLLSFDDLVSAKTVNVKGISFQSTNNLLLTNSYRQSLNMSLLPSISLTSAYNNIEIQGNTTGLTIFLNSNDFATLQLASPLFDSLSTTFITLDTNSIYSPYGIPNIEINSTNGLMVDSIKKDSFPPYLINFQLNMDTGKMFLLFSEPINVTTFHLFGLTIQGQSYIGDKKQGHAIVELNGPYVHLVDSPNSFLVETSNYNRLLVYQLGVDNLNSIKAITDLAISLETSYISAYTPFINDLSGNPVSLVDIDRFHALKASKYTADITSPLLLYWNFNRLTGRVELTFSETIDIHFLNYSRIVFVSDPSALASVFNPITTLRVDSPIITTHNNTDKVTFTLNKEQLTSVESSTTLLQSKYHGSYIVLEYLLTLDTSTLQNKYQGNDSTYHHPKAVRKFYNDNNAPILKFFTLNMKTRILTLTFTEPIRLSSIQLQYLTLQSSKLIDLTTEILVLSNSICKIITTEETGVVDVLFTSSTAYSILAGFQYLAKSAATTFICLSREFATDTRANIANKIERIKASYAMRASNFIPDDISPSLDRWMIDLDLAQIQLNFSRPIDVTTIEVQLLALSSDPVILPSTELLFLSNSSYALPAPILALEQTSVTQHTMVWIDVATIQLSQEDLKRIKLLYALCRSIDSCYLTYSSEFALDIASIIANNTFYQLSVLPVNFEAPYLYIPDTTPPHILNCTVDMNLQLLRFSVNEPVDSTTWNATVVHLIYYHNILKYDLLLSEYSVEQDERMSMELVVELTMYDYIRIQQAKPLATIEGSVNITLLTGAIQDAYGNSLLTQNIIPSKFIDDTSSPQLIAVYLDYTLNNRNLSLYFNEMIHLSTIQKSFVFLVASSGATVSLANAVIYDSQEDSSRMVKFDISSMVSELNILNLANQQSNTLVYISKTGTIMDDSVNRNPIKATPITLSITDGLSLKSFRLDMIKKYLYLELRFPYLINSIDLSKLTLLPSGQEKLINTLTYTLVGASKYYYDMHGPFLVIELTNADYIAIRSIFTIYSKNDIELSVNFDAVIDINGKHLASSNILECSLFIYDSTELFITSYKLDLNEGTLQIHFNKEVETSTLDLMNTLALQSSHQLNASSINFLLNNLTVIDQPDILGYISPNISTLFLSLNHGYPLTLREQILAFAPLATTIDSTYLTAKKGMVYDLARPRNPVNTISIKQAKQVSQLILDREGPVLVSFNIDFSQRILTLFYNEAINSNTVHVDRIFLLKDRFDPLSITFQLTLTSKVIISLHFLHEIQVQLSTSDINNIMNLSPQDLFVSSETSYIYTLDGIVQDIAAPPNDAPEVILRYGVPVNVFISDTLPPEALWYNISVETGNMVIFFNELVPCFSINPSFIIFQYEAYTGTTMYHYQLSTKASVDCTGAEFNNYAFIAMDVEDILQLKAFGPNFAKTKDHLNVRFLSGAFKDVSGNLNEEILDGDALAPTQFDGDFNRPELLSWLINQEKQLSMFFIEPMDIGTLNILEFWVQNERVNPTMSYQLMVTSLFRVDPLRMRYDFDLLDDYNRIALDGVSVIFNIQERTFLRYSWKAMNDTSANAILPVDRNDSIPLGPTVNQWNLDMNTGLLELVFSERVNPNFTCIGIEIQNEHSKSDQSIIYALTTNQKFQHSHPASVSTYPYSFMIYTILNKHDMDSLKFMLITKQDILYMTMKFNITQSNNAGDIIPYFTTVEVFTHRARKISRYIRDITPPVCLSFSLDLGLGYFNLHFNEPVLVASLNLAGMVLFSNITGDFVILSDVYTSAELYDYVNVRIVLSIQDLISIKLAIKSKLSGTIHILDSLVMKNNSIQDFLYNKLIGNTPQTPIPIQTNYILDTIPPSLVSWDIDLRALVLKLTFNEAIDLTSLHPSNIYLLSDSNYTTSTHRIQLSYYSLIANSLNNQVITNVITIDLGIYRYDSYRIQDIFTWGQYINETYLAISTVSDVFGNNNSVIQVSRVNHIQLNSRLFSLEAFDIQIDNANSKVLVTVYLSNIVNIHTFSCSDYYFSEGPSSASNKIVLTNSNCVIHTLNNNYIVNFNFPVSLLSTASNFGSSISKSWVYLPNNPGITADINENSLFKINPDLALNVGPQVLGFSLNLQDGILIYIYSKEIDLSIQIDISSLGFYNSYTKHTYYLQSKLMTLQQPSIFLPTGNNMCQYAELILDSIDLSNIKLLNADSSNLYGLINFDPLVPNQVLVDSNGIRLVNRDETIHPLLVSNLLQDTTPPYIVDTTIDLSNNTFTIQFNTPMRLNSIILTQLCFQTTMDVKNSKEYFYCLTGGEMLLDLNNVIIDLTNADTSALKIMLNTLYGSNVGIYKLYLSFIYNTAQDLIGNLLSAISFHKALLIHTILEDLIPPRIIFMKFDLNFFDYAELTLFFSEPVDPYMLQTNISKLIIQSRFASRDGPIYQLTGGVITSAILSTIVIQLTSYDINQMKSLFVIIRNMHAAYLVIPPYLTTDLVGNPLVPFLDGNALVCNEYIYDRIPPRIITSTFNLDQGIITLVLTEPILLQSINTTSLTIQYQSIEGLHISTKRYKLTSNSYISNLNTLSSTVVINLCINDQNELKVRYPLVSDKATTWFSFSSSFLEDVSLNHIQLVTISYPIQVVNYISDKTKPIVLLYLIDMNFGYILLTFSESIFMVDLSQIDIQNVETRRFGNYIYLNETAINYLNSTDINTYSIGLFKDSNSLKINLDNDILAYMKYYHIGVDIYSSYLVWSDRFVSDYSKNYLAPFWDASVYGYNPRVPDIIHTDITPPLLKRWFLDRKISTANIIYTNMTAYLYFNEPIYIKDLSQLKIHYCQINKKNKCIKEINKSYSLLSFNHTIEMIDITYESYQRELIITLSNYCSVEEVLQLSITSLQISISNNYINQLCKQNYIDLFTFLNQKLINHNNNERYGYFITSSNLAVEDFSKNYLQTIDFNQAMIEKLPDCSYCPIGQYQNKECTLTTDRQCKLCSNCNSGTFIYTNCTAKLDTSCKLCDSCGYGNYIVNQCSIFHNTQCARCSICNSMEIETSKCILGNNTICNSCKICDFHNSNNNDNNNNNNNMDIKKQCLLDKSYSSWYQSSCCKDKNGKPILCKDKDYTTMLESSINGRHQWSTDQTSPRINMNLETNKKYKFPNSY